MNKAQLSLLPPLAPPPRRKPQKLMHLTDAGQADKPIVFFECKRCGHRSGWVYSEGLAKDKRGIACPVCNGESSR